MPARKAARRTGDAPIGVMGGTFDPVHFGHLRLAQEAAEILGLERVRWVPAGRPWHRAQPKAPPRHRLQMVRLAIRRNPLFELDDAEIRQGLPGYTVETLARLRKRLGADRPLVLLLGADAFRGLASWKRWREIFELAHVFVGQRPGQPLTPGSLPAALASEWRRRAGTSAALRGQPAGRVVTYGTTALDISASAIRAQLAQSRSPRYLLPAAVLDYIRARRLYATGATRR
jgi:nicotinate-nucleotide adenylyltransferase